MPVPPRAAPELPPEVRWIDAHGGTIMPGLIESHFHATYFNVAALEDLDTKYPVEYVTLLASANAKLALECGYTSARSGSWYVQHRRLAKKSHRQRPHSRPAPGSQRPGNLQRRRAHGLEPGVSQDRHGRAGAAVINGATTKRRAAVRKLVKDGVEWVKTYPTGDAAAPRTNDHHTLCMTLDEMKAVVELSHNHGLKVTGHCRATEGIKNALLAGYDTLEHASSHGRRSP